jgi:hypothetical protein
MDLHPYEPYVMTLHIMTRRMLIYFFIWVGRKKGQGNWAWKGISMNGISRKTSFFWLYGFHFTFKGLLIYF